MISKSFVLSTVAALATLATAPAVLAQQKYPCDIVKFVVPYPPGGASDPMARMLIPTLNKRLGTSIIVENIAGASGSIGVSHVAGAKADGCTWLLGGSSAVMVGRNLFKMKADPLEALVPIAQISAIPMVLYTNPQTNKKSVAELVDLLKAEPGKHTFGTPGSGTMHHLLNEQFTQHFKAPATHVPYKGSGPAIQDVLGGHTSFSFEATSAIIPHVRAGKAIALATTGEARSAGLPEVPTMKELGAPELTVTNWYGVFAPKGTPNELLIAINAAVREAQGSKEVAEALAKMDSQHAKMDLETFQKFVKADAPRWEQTVKALGLKID